MQAKKETDEDKADRVGNTSLRWGLGDDKDVILDKVKYQVRYLVSERDWMTWRLRGRAGMPGVESAGRRWR